MSPKADIINTFYHKLVLIKELTEKKEQFKGKDIPEIDMQYDEAMKDKTGAMWIVKDALEKMIVIFKDSQIFNFRINGYSTVLKVVDIKDI